MESVLSALAVAKHDTINAFVSKAFDDNRVTDIEFKHATHEMKSYAKMKEALRARFAKKQPDSNPPDLKKIREEVREEFRKKLAASAALN